MSTHLYIPLGEEGVIEGAFGTTGKFRLNMPGK